MDVKVAAKLTKELIPKEIISVEASYPSSLEHIKYMLESINNGLVTKEKAHRWLGWAQAIVCHCELATLDDLKKINKLS